MKISTVGLDLAKNVFQDHGIDEAGEVVMRKTLRRRKMIPFFSKLGPCLIGMEACGTGHHWARELSGFLKRAMIRYGWPDVVVTDQLRSYRAAIKVIGVSGRQNCGR